MEIENSGTNFGTGNPALVPAFYDTKTGYIFSDFSEPEIKVEMLEFSIPTFVFLFNISACFKKQKRKWSFGPGHLNEGSSPPSCIIFAKG